MITKISLSQVASYKTETSLETDKKVNIIYGLNGTGKSTLSGYLYHRDDPRYSHCSIDGLTNNDKMLVYNQQFINDEFHARDEQKGIFTLSKTNADIEKQIKAEEELIEQNGETEKVKQGTIQSLINDLAKKKEDAEKKTWDIKTKYYGGDRLLEYCLTEAHVAGSKESLFNYLLSFTNPTSEPQKTVDDLKKDVESIKGANAQKYEQYNLIAAAIIDESTSIESNELLSKVIIGNENSSISGLIKKLGNADWVQQGLAYIPTDYSDTDKIQCPFCQENTIAPPFIEQIKNYFDESYQNDIESLSSVLTKAESLFSHIPVKSTYLNNPFIEASRTAFDSLYDKIQISLQSAIHAIKEKLTSPSKQITITGIKASIEGFNKYLAEINSQIKINNDRIDNKTTELAKIKNTFWQIMRYKYDQTLSAFAVTKADIDNKTAQLKGELTAISDSTRTLKKKISEQQKQTINITESIEHINNALLELGIDSFRIIQHSESLYRITRGNDESNTFSTLSEGEKMIISFLYFVELCRGKADATEITNNKIIVIDDPISSLSHIFVFNIAELIKHEFTNKDSPYLQIFLLTHNLYFFYEMTDINNERRDQYQKLFRIIKNTNGSSILNMKYQEIQNEYQSYWYIVNDKNQPPALIANCMRNIIEYFYNFIEKAELNNVFQKEPLKQNKYQAFYRYINRESHSLGQNVFDFKDFDYEMFREAFKLVFVEQGYSEHYKKMSKIKPN